MTAEPAAPAPDPSTWTLPRIAITRDGDWRHDGEEVTHPGIIANLRETLRVDEHGAHYIDAGRVRVPVEVEDTPFVALRAEPEGDAVTLTLNDLTREPLDPATLTFAADGAPRCRVKGGRFAARLTRAATYQLLQHVEHDEAGRRAALVVGGARHALQIDA